MNKSNPKYLVVLKLLIFLFILADLELQPALAQNFEQIDCREKIECDQGINCQLKIDSRNCSTEGSTGALKIDQACAAEKAMLNNLYQAKYEECVETQKQKLETCERKKDRHREICSKYSDLTIDYSYQGSLKIIDNFLSGKDVRYAISQNTSGIFEDGYPDSIVIHFTGLLNFQATLKWLSSPKSNASFHVLIGRNGEIAQLVPFNYSAWHAGSESYAGRTGYNRYSIGIGLDNAMMLEKKGDKYLNFYGVEIPADEVIEASSKYDPKLRYWHKYSDIQIQKITEVCKLLAKAYKIKMILGHADLSPGRKFDPGPAFPDMDQFSEKIFDNLISED